MSKVVRLLCSCVLALALCLGAAANVKQPKGFDGKVFKASYGLYASSESKHVTFPRFICTVTAFQKYRKGYLFVGAGHCTSANPDLPSDLKYYVESDLDSASYPVKLLYAKLDGPSDFSVFYLETDKKLQTIALGDESTLRVGDKVVDVNFSLGLSKETSHGIVSTQIVKSGDMAGFYGVDMFDSHGASGSAVVDERSHKIVGLVIAGVDGATLPTWIEPISTVKSELDKLNLDKLIDSPESPKADSPLERRIPLWQ